MVRVVCGSGLGLGLRLSLGLWLGLRLGSPRRDHLKDAKAWMLSQFSLAKEVRG